MSENISTVFGLFVASLNFVAVASALYIVFNGKKNEAE